MAPQCWVAEGVVLQHRFLRGRGAFSANPSSLLSPPLLPFTTPRILSLCWAGLVLQAALVHRSSSPTTSASCRSHTLLHSLFFFRLLPPSRPPAFSNPLNLSRILAPLRLVRSRNARSDRHLPVLPPAPYRLVHVQGRRGEAPKGE